MRDLHWKSRKRNRVHPSITPHLPAIYNATIVSPVRRVTSIRGSYLANTARFQKSHADHDPGEIVRHDNDPHENESGSDRVADLSQVLMQILMLCRIATVSGSCE